MVSKQNALATLDTLILIFIYPCTNILTAWMYFLMDLLEEGRSQIQFPLIPLIRHPSPPVFKSQLDDQFAQNQCIVCVPSHHLTTIFHRLFILLLFGSSLSLFVWSIAPCWLSWPALHLIHLKLFLKINLRKKLTAVESEFAKTLAVTYYRFNLLSFTTQKVSPVKRQKQAVVKPVHAIIL